MAPDPSSLYGARLCVCGICCGQARRAGASSECQAQLRTPPWPARRLPAVHRWLPPQTWRPARSPARPPAASTCVLRFCAGPPYEDIAFRIINKEWCARRRPRARPAAAAVTSLPAGVGVLPPPPTCPSAPPHPLTPHPVPLPRNSPRFTRRNYNHKHGFKCTFERGILHLYFNFQRQRYRR